MRLIEALARLKPGDVEAVLRRATDKVVLGARLDFRNWAHDGQDEPEGPWKTWVVKAGRGFGKTRVGSEWVAARARADGALKIALVAASLDEARRIMVEGNSGLLAVAGSEISAWWPTRRLLRFKSGAEATLFSGAKPDGLRGPDHHIAWCDELAKWTKAQETWDMLQFGLRLGDAPRAIVTTTPRAGSVLTAIMAAKGTVVTGGSTHHNPHLPPVYVETVEELYAGTRLGRQELDGELLPDAEGALWSIELLEWCRVDAAVPGDVRASLRTVIGVDPPSGNGTCGIIACALDGSGTAYVLADHSVTGRSPGEWAEAVAAAARIQGTSRIIAETNQGGLMVEAVLRSVDAKLRVTSVTARLGKSERATPISSLFEAGKVKLCGRFPALEAELCGLIAGGGYDPVWSGGPDGPGKSPDRADAMVWALSDLMPARERAVARVRVM